VAEKVFLDLASKRFGKEEKICGIINYDAIFVSGAQFAKRRATWRRRIKYTVSMIFLIFLDFDSTYNKIQIYPVQLNLLFNK
jgi:hypothetical protein